MEYSIHAVATKQHTHKNCGNRRKNAVQFFPIHSYYFVPSLFFIHSNLLCEIIIMECTL